MPLALSGALTPHRLLSRGGNGAIHRNRQDNFYTVEQSQSSLSRIFCVLILSNYIQLTGDEGTLYTFPLKLMSIPD